jgi:predicted PurR-regulated permease PerM
MQMRSVKPQTASKLGWPEHSPQGRSGQLDDVMESDIRTQQRLHLIGLVAITVVSLCLSSLLAAPFLSALISATALAVVIMPLHRWVEMRIKRASIASGVTVTFAAALLIVPTLFVGEQILIEASSAARLISANIRSGAWRAVIADHQRLAPAAGWIEQQVNLPRTAENTISWLTDIATSLVQGSGAQLVGTLITFYFLFYFLRDRRVALAAVAALSPLNEAEMSVLTARVADTIRATVYGTFVVAMIQGMLGGLIFWWLGLPTPLLWGVVMGLLAIIPVLGAFIIWIPAAVFLWLTGHQGSALILILWGTIVVGGIDNLIYPMLVGNRLKMHTVPTFISLVGGLIVFGTPGLILGPIVLTVTMFLVEYWREHIDQRHDGNGSEL